MKRWIGFLIIVFFLGTISPAFGQTIPLNGLSLRLVPKSKTEDEMGTKTVVISQNKSGIKLSWHSLVKELDENAYYPTYKVQAKKGLIETDSLDLKTAFFQPSLWGMGYIRSDTALPLWVDSEYLNLKGRQKRQFNVGLLNNSKFILKSAPGSLFEKLNYFQNLYDQYIRGGEVRSDVKLSRRREKDLKKFVDDFFMVRTIAKAKAALVVKGKKQEFDSRIIGNNYYHLIVLDNPANPLVLHFKMFPEKAPKVFEKVLKELAKSLEFQVTQLSF